MGERSVHPLLPVTFNPQDLKTTEVLTTNTPAEQQSGQMCHRVAPRHSKRKKSSKQKCLLGVCGHKKFQQDSVIICQEFVVVKDCVRQSKCLQALHIINKLNPTSLFRQCSETLFKSLIPHLHLELTSALGELITSAHCYKYRRKWPPKHCVIGSLKHSQKKTHGLCHVEYLHKSHAIMCVYCLLSSV